MVPASFGDNKVLRDDHGEAPGEGLEEDDWLDAVAPTPPLHPVPRQYTRDNQLII